MNDWWPGRRRSLRRAPKPVSRALLACVLTAGAGIGCSEGTREADREGTVRSAVVGGSPSTAADDFIVYVNHGEGRGCGGTLVAPNLVLTAKHCVYTFVRGPSSICDASGEPQPGSTGGYVTGSVPLEDIRVLTGPDARRKFFDGEPPAAVATRIIDDGTPTLCSHDLAYVLLDRAIEGVPLGRLRLGKRPEPGLSSRISLAGWGQAEDRLVPAVRLRRDGITIQRVGLPSPSPDVTGDLGPRTFETGPGGCSGDSGSPGFDATTGAVLGLLARALDLDDGDPVSPCRPETVRNVYMVVADFPVVLRTAFAAAAAEPWLDSRPEPGFAHFGEACDSNLECASDVCEGAGEIASGTCNLDCSEAGAACPDGFVCGEAARCVVPTEVIGEADGGAEAGAPAPEPRSGCASAPVAPRGTDLAWLLGACVALATRVRNRFRR